MTKDKQYIYFANGVDQVVYFDTTGKTTTTPPAKFIEHVGKPVFIKCPEDDMCIIAADGQHINVNPEVEHLVNDTQRSSEHSTSQRTSSPTPVNLNQESE